MTTPKSEIRRIVCIAGPGLQSPVRAGKRPDIAPLADICVISTGWSVMESILLPGAKRPAGWTEPVGRSGERWPYGWVVEDYATPGSGRPTLREPRFFNVHSVLRHADRFVVCADAYGNQTQIEMLRGLMTVNPNADCLVFPFRNAWHAYGLPELPSPSAAAFETGRQAAALVQQYGSSAAEIAGRIETARLICGRLSDLRPGRWKDKRTISAHADFMHLQLLFHLARRTDGIACDIGGMDTEDFVNDLGVEAWRSVMARSRYTCRTDVSEDGTRVRITITPFGLELTREFAPGLEDREFSRRFRHWVAIGYAAAEPEIDAYKARMRWIDEAFASANPDGRAAA